MKFDDVHIPVGAAWSSPFCRWQGSLSDVSSLDLAALVTRTALDARGIEAGELTDIVFGSTIPQPASFYSTPTLAHAIGAGGISGPLIAQACATSAAVIGHAAAATQLGSDRLVLAVTADRTSNGPFVVYPTARGRVQSEDWVMDNIARDPVTGRPMIDTAEQVARAGGYSRAQLDDLTLQRYEQYQDALADDRAFQRRYFVPVTLQTRKSSVVVHEDEGIHPSTLEGLTALATSVPSGVVTAGTQTHPADGAAGMILTTLSRARELSRDGATARVLSTAIARAEPGAMPKAPVPAARQALHEAGIGIEGVDVIKTHNPFVVNDLWFADQMGVKQDKINAFGSSLVYGHPQGPTGMRAITELIEILAMRGGGVGLFTGCAAGDSAGAVVVEVTGS
jgi:acetyl-CoA acetyltransferase family protein